MPDREENFIKFFNDMISQSRVDTIKNVTQLYIEGRIDKDEFMRRMKNAN